MGADRCPPCVELHYEIRVLRLRATDRRWAVCDLLADRHARRTTQCTHASDAGGETMVAGRGSNYIAVKRSQNLNAESLVVEA
jgi:hypothetical protein